jgi:predicted ribonuclease toxin of YeeF-YezG toxin-antitoxin module
VFGVAIARIHDLSKFPTDRINVYIKGTGGKRIGTFHQNRQGIRILSSSVDEMFDKSPEEGDYDGAYDPYSSSKYYI